MPTSSDMVGMGQLDTYEIPGLVNTDSWDIPETNSAPAYDFGLPQVVGHHLPPTPQLPPPVVEQPLPKQIITNPDRNRHPGLLLPGRQKEFFMAKMRKEAFRVMNGGNKVVAQDEQRRDSGATDEGGPVAEGEAEQLSKTDLKEPNEKRLSEKDLADLFGESDDSRHGEVSFDLD
ncbi:Hypothetical protein D9617_12g035390 [Elsinoe fawcettii]|nr:Hypothetical protein D9617_12g035390 [Elsinoe fawcettii]